MPRPSADSLSRRERQIMDILHRVRRATVAEVREQLATAPSYSAVRTLPRILEDKGHVRHVTDGPRYVYTPVASGVVERRSALRHLVYTFFDGSADAAMLALLESSDGTLDRKRLDELGRRIAAARREGR
jgi:predicted transcriptional regulator